ncbi:MAG: hypothetical protein ACFFEK_03320 [Candidatus Thorarchaeota archaeon]
MRMYKALVLTIIILMMTTSATSPDSRIEMTTTSNYSITQSPTDLSGVNVGIFNLSYYDPRVNNSYTALINMFEWMNATVRFFNTTDIINGSLWACEVFAMPEGLGPILEHKLTDEGLQAIREWVAAGGSYIGVRGSAAMAVQYSYFELIWTEFKLAMINGTSYEVEDLNPTTMTNVTINKECTGPDLSDMPDRMQVLFKTGRYILPNEGQELIYIANYTHNNLPAMVASYYGEGTIFISSPHFEYEENGDRDGTDYLDEYDDPDSEWPLILRITQWLVDSTPTVCNITEWPTKPTPALLGPSLNIILIASGVGVVVIILVFVLIKKR